MTPDLHENPLTFNPRTTENPFLVGYEYCFNIINMLKQHNENF